MTLSSDTEPRIGPSGGIDTLTADGAIVRIRPAGPDDASDLTALYQRASDESLYRRFFSMGRSQIFAEVARDVRPAEPGLRTLVAVEHGRLIGVGSYARLDDPGQAEFAIFVDDAAHDRGIGTLLLEHLTVHARRDGVRELVGDVLPTNAPMMRVATDIGRPMRTHFDAGVVQVRLDTTADPSDAVDQRDLAAAAHSLRSLFAPACVAVVGAGRHPGGIGHTVLRAISDGGFTGTVYAVNPGATDIAGVPCYPTIADAPMAPDLVVVAVPAPAVAGVLADAGAAGARTAVVLSSGFSEEGPEGRQRQRELVRIARQHGIRMVGPNCLGIVNNDPAVRLNATFAAGASAGGLAVASQSGAVGISLLAEAAATGLGVASFVSLGNKADVSGNDLLSYWYDEPSAKAVALYLESLGNPRRFARIARAVARRKPVLAVKSGRTESGSRAGASHTAAAAAPDRTVDALFQQAGVIRCDGLRALIDTARLVVDQPLPAGPRIAVLGNAGGINVLCADAADAGGLRLPVMAENVQQRIRAAAPGISTAANPIDLGAAANADAIGTTIAAVGPFVDSIVVAFGATMAADVPAIVHRIGSALDATPLPAAVVLLGVDDAPTHLGKRRVPVYRLPEDAIAAMARAVRYGQWRAAPLGEQPELPGIDPVRARRLVDRALGHGGGWLTVPEAAAILECYGIPVAPTVAVDTEADAVAAASGMPEPVVVKSAAPDLVHKTDVGGVRLNVVGESAVRQAYRDIAAATGDPRVIVQAQAPSGVELVAGISHDPLFGSVLMCGLGGVLTDLLGDRALRLLPVTDVDAARMWRDLRGARLLTGYRGSTPADTGAVEHLLMRLGRLAEDLPEVAELDCNPVIVHTSGLLAVDVKMRVATVGDEPDAALRGLREPS
jgi:acyl-CoA synthetase (NDP forming)/L-amino acid N-acyltransferase YncA